MKTEDANRLRAGFPLGLRAEMNTVLELLPPAPHPTSGSPIAEATLSGERICIPGRVYFKSAQPPALLSPAEREIWRCIYSRHHDGHVREASLRALLERPIRPWVAPFVLQLAGEYVIEIILPLLEAGLDEQHAVLDFVAENEAFLALTESRAISYWNEYYRSHYSSYARTKIAVTGRHQWYKKEDYPALVLLGRLSNPTNS